VLNRFCGSGPAGVFPVRCNCRCIAIDLLHRLVSRTESAVHGNSSIRLDLGGVLHLYQSAFALVKRVGMEQ
jgi:hypothetical protein